MQRKRRFSFSLLLRIYFRFMSHFSPVYIFSFIITKLEDAFFMSRELLLPSRSDHLWGFVGMLHCEKGVVVVGGEVEAGQGHVVGEVFGRGKVDDGELPGGELVVGDLEAGLDPGL